MAELFRSQDIHYVRLIMSEDAAYDTVRALGDFKRLHVLDLSAEPGSASGPSDSGSYYKRRVALCQSWERKFDTFREAFQQYSISLPDRHDPLAVEIQPLRASDLLDACATFVEPLEESLAQHVQFRRQQRQQLNEYVEYMHVLRFNEHNQFASAERAEQLGAYPMEMEMEVGAFQQMRDEQTSSDAMESGEQHNRHNLFTNTMCGVMPQDKIIAFERMLFRASRGNAFATFYEIPELIEDPASGDPVKKSVFALTFMGEQLSRRLRRLISYSSGSEYRIPASRAEIMALERDISAKLHDAEVVLQRTEAEIRDLLSSLAVDPNSPQHGPAISPFYNWLRALQQERAICDTLRKCEQEGPHSKMLTLEGWCPAADLSNLSLALQQAVELSHSNPAALQVFDHPPAHVRPPTYLPTNKFTEAFQGIVDTYGVPRYKEVNPGLFTIITFPFLFGVMFGDIGHGTLLLLASLVLIAKEKSMLEQKKRGEMGEILGMVFGGRYLLLLMGGFALYAGTIYNDCFSIPTNLFGSQWSLPANVSAPFPANTSGLDYFSGTPYPYGIDPAWYHTSNELAFFNSFKMKLAVTLGVIHMLFGICLGALNHAYNNDKLALAFEFVPRMVFILCTFGYMVFLILFKLCYPWGPTDTPPLIIQTMIQMFLSPGSVEAEDQLFAGQAGVQAVLLLLAFLAVPFMLFPIPFITNKRNQAYLQKHGLVPAGQKEEQGQEIQLLQYGSMDQHNSPRHDVGLGESSSSSASLREQLIDRSENSELAASPSGIVIDDREEAKEEEGLAMLPSPPPEGHGEHALGVDYSYSDHLIISGIHTIEYVLGTVSNTASYLRLWALSLAHAQLASVFWDKMIMQYGIENESPIFAFVGMGVWVAASFSVLMCMDCLECFLHALRLHWVEFQNKFFAADGYAFEPFSFDKLEEEGSAF